MPGFKVHGDFGGNRNAPEAKLDYYYNYFWEIDSLFETNFDAGSALISLRDAGTPTFTVNKETYQGASLEYKFAKSVIWDDIKVSWYDTDGLVDAIEQWRQTVWSPGCGLRQASEYKKESRITSFLPTGKSDVAWLLRNSWPSQIKYGDLTYTTSDIKIVEVTVTYDWAERFDTTGGGGGLGSTTLKTLPNQTFPELIP